MYGGIVRNSSELGGVSRRNKKRSELKVRMVSAASEDYVHPFVTPLKMETANVPIELDSDFQEWCWWTPVLIDAPTGTGKSTFVIDKLLPFVIERKGRLLIVSNRIALNTQYKNQVLKKYNHPALKLLTPQGIQETQEFDGLPAVFCSYQGLAGLMNREDEGFTHVVLDEAHFFCSDALFAQDTGWLLSKIAESFQGAVRIYMTATPWAVESMIAEVEQNSIPSILALNAPYTPRLLAYRFPVSPRNYQLHALPAETRSNHLHPALLEKIEASPPREKWLIFVDSKTYGRQLSKVLDDAAYLDASGKSGALWQELVTTSRFTNRILIATSVADCGLNISDKAVKHVVLYSVDHVQFMQELGRKRLKRNEVVHIYVPDLSLSQLAHMQSKNRQLLEVLHEYKANPDDRALQRLNIWFSDNPEDRHLIPILGSGKLHINRCAEQVVRQRALHYQELRGLQEVDHRIPFIEMVRRWLALPETALEDAFDLTDKVKLLKFLEESCNTPLKSKTEQESFSVKYRELRVKAYGPRESGGRRRAAWGAKIICEDLEVLELPFTLITSNGEWEIIKGRRDNNEN